MHGADGNSELTDYPIVAGQTARYSYLQLRDYKFGRRTDEMMNTVAAGLEKQDMTISRVLRVTAAEGAADPGGESSVPFTPDPARWSREEKIGRGALHHVPPGRVCREDEVPRVAGQHSRIRRQTLKAYKTGMRTNDAGTMSTVSKTSR